LFFRYHRMEKCWCSVKRNVFLKSIHLRVKNTIMMNSVSFLKCGRWWPPWVAIRDLFPGAIQCPWPVTR
jgi:hypothetical protein